MFRSVYSKIMLINLVITIVIVVASTGLLFGLLNSYMIEDRSKSLSDEADRLNNLTVFYISNHNPNVERLYYMSLNDISNRINGVIFIVDSFGNLIHSDNASEHIDTSKIPEMQIAQRVREGEKIVNVGDFGGLFETTYLTVGVPLYFEGTGVGATFLSMPVPEINRYKYQMFRIFFSSVSVATVIAMMISYAYSRRVSRPLKDLSVAAKKVSAGDFDVRVSERGKGEIAELSRSFNLMVSSLGNLEDMRSSFIANVSHELRTPMTTISGFIEGILDHTIPEGSEEKYLQIVLDETKRLARLVGELLDLARMDAGTVQLNIKPFDINELIRITILRFEKQINAKSVSVNIDFQQEQANVTADKDSISRVLTNLFENALKFNFEHGYIDIKVKSKGGKYEISVENSGIGIDEEEITHVWERFYKTDKSRAYDKKGMGLGLYLVHNTLAAHGEKIWVESEKDHWARFTFTLKKT